MLTDCNSLVTVCASKTSPKPSPLDPMQPVMERSHPTSGRSATPADINRNGRPTSIGTSGRHQSECPADIIGMRKIIVPAPNKNQPAPSDQNRFDVARIEKLVASAMPTCAILKWHDP